MARAAPWYPPQMHEIPAGAVPQSAQQHGDHQVGVGADSPAIAAQRNINVIAQPVRKRDMPAPPEFRHARERYGGGNFRENESQTAGRCRWRYRYSPRSRRRSAARRQWRRSTREESLRRAVGVANNGPPPARTGRRRPASSPAGKDRRKASLPFLARRRTPVEVVEKNSRGAHDGPGHQLRKERHEERVIDITGNGGLFAAIYIDYIRNTLKCMEADSERQDNIERTECAL